jgi:glucan phosphoethanolaminetransferase (alkaline phosphatase superfamily)
LWIGVVVVAIISVGVIGRLWVANDSVQHVILISLDTARRDHFGCYGNTWIKTPNVDALARESILFTD